MVGGELVGRESEVSALAGLLCDEAVRLVTVTGPAGVGKTRVAYAVAERLTRDRSLRCVRVGLGPLGEPALVADAIAAAAGAGERMMRGSALEAAGAALAGAPTLLVLDNFEHVEAAAGDVAALLDICPAVTALVTSRHVLGLSSEHMFPLAPLAQPGSEDRDAARAGRCASVALFVARARARDPAFELTDELVPAVVEICRRLDGLPLAIELVAGRAAAVPPPALLARWEDAIGLDTGGAADLPPRQRTLRRALDWSYDLLEPQEQALLRRLAAFPGGFDVGAVEAACHGDGATLPPLDLQPIATLARFVERSLVGREGGPAAEPRYAQLVTVRRYLRERLEQHDEAPAADRLLANACLSLARTAGMFGLSAKTLDRLERELNNFHAALDVLVRTDPPAALELAADLFGFWRTRHVREGREWLERSLAAAGQDLPTPSRSRGLWTATMLAVLQGDAAALHRFAPAALDAAHETGDRLLIGRALIGSAALATADGADGTSYLHESRALAEETGDLPVLAAASNMLGELVRRAGDVDEAGVLFERAHVLWRELGDATGVATTAHNLAWIMVERGELDRAGDLLLEALDGSARIGNRYLRALVLAAVTTVAARRGPSAAVATLYGATQAEIEAGSAVLDRLEREAFREAEASLRTALAETAFAAAQARGRALGEREQRHLVERLLASPATATAGPLTRRELDVVRLMAAGLTNAEIAERLVLSDHTVHRHVANILRKLNARSRAAAAIQAAHAGLL